MTTRVEIVNDFLAINVKPGSTIQDVVEASGSALPFGCRDGQCGTCLVTIEQGMEFISELNEKEKKVIAEEKERERMRTNDPQLAINFNKGAYF